MGGRGWLTSFVAGVDLVLVGVEGCSGIGDDAIDRVVFPMVDLLVQCHVFTMAVGVRVAI